MLCCIYVLVLESGKQVKSERSSVSVKKPPYHTYRSYAGHPGKTRLFTFMTDLLGRLLALRFKVRLEGWGNLNREGPVLVLGKHQYLTDVPLGHYLYVNIGRRRDIWCVMKHDLAERSFGMLERAGGIPLNRKNPERSRASLTLARRVLYEGNLLTIFPEQHLTPGKMARGKSPGFRFLTSNPDKPLAINVMGYEYGPRRFLRKTVTIRIGPTRYYHGTEEHVDFLHDCMKEMAELSGMQYRFAKPAHRKNAAGDDLIKEAG